MTRQQRWYLYAVELAAVMTIVILLAAVVGLHLTRPPLSRDAQVMGMEHTYQARVLAVLDERTNDDGSGLVQITQLLQIRILDGQYADQEFEVLYNGMGPTLRDVQFRPGSRIMVMERKRPDGRVDFGVAGPMRLGQLGLIAGFFIALTLVIGRWRGLGALVGLALSGVLIGGFILPQILSLRDPVFITLVGMAFLLAITLYLIQGWNLVAHAALFGMVVSLLVTGFLAWAWTFYTGLTGFGSEETLYLQSVGLQVQMRGLLLAGMIIGVAGVLDDVVLAQATAVYELASVSPELTVSELYRRGMKIGIAHLASMVNTLVLAYASAALPLMLLFWLYPEPWYMTLNREMIAEEIVRTLVGSVGLMLAVPLTTLITARLARITIPVPSQSGSSGS